MRCDQVALLRLLITQEIGSLVQNYNDEQQHELDLQWEDFEDSFSEDYERRMVIKSILNDTNNN